MRVEEKALVLSEGRREIRETQVTCERRLTLLYFSFIVSRFILLFFFLVNAIVQMRFLTEGPA